MIDNAMDTGFDDDGETLWLPDEHFMKLALDQAICAWENDEVPVGCVIARQGKVIAAAFNQREMLRDPTAHAEMLAITQAAESVGDWRLEGCRMYVTLEPCPMCAGAILLGRIPELVFGAVDPKAGAVQSLYQLTNDPRLNHQVAVRGGVMASACGDILTSFFQEKRRAGKK
jgi:tRNA(adenine34) deaminase